MFVKPEPYLELSRASVMELSCKISELLSVIFTKKTETFKMKLRLNKSSRLLKCAAFLVFIDSGKPYFSEYLKNCKKMFRF